jgi:hypothetical protein
VTNVENETTNERESSQSPKHPLINQSYDQ